MNQLLTEERPSWAIHDLSLDKRNESAVLIKRKDKGASAARAGRWVFTTTDDLSDSTGPSEPLGKEKPIVV